MSPRKVLIAFLRKHGIQQLELALFLAVTDKTVSNWARGKTPTPMCLAMLLVVIDYRADEEKKPARAIMAEIKKLPSLQPRRIA